MRFALRLCCNMLPRAVKDRNRIDGQNAPPPLGSVCLNLLKMFVACICSWFMQDVQSDGPNLHLTCRKETFTFKVRSIQNLTKIEQSGVLKSSFLGLSHVKNLSKISKKSSKVVTSNVSKAILNFSTALDRFGLDSGGSWARHWKVWVRFEFHVGFFKKFI